VSYYDPKAGRSHWTSTATPPFDATTIDAGLRAYMLRVYNYMAGGLLLTGVVAYAATSSGFILIGLIGIVIASIVNIFIGSSTLQFVISIVSVIVFVGLTAYDTQRIKELYLESDTDDVASKKAILGALSLYLDFINLFMLLQLFGQRRQE
jgi:FtsH-binding integral membrane protein